MSFVDSYDEYEDSPFVRAAKRTRAFAGPRLPVQGQQEPQPYIIDPDLVETQQGKITLPTDIAINEAGIPFNIKTG